MSKNKLVRLTLLLLGVYIFYSLGLYHLFMANILWLGPLLLIICITIKSKGVRSILKGDFVRYMISLGYLLIYFDIEKTKQAYVEWISEIEIFFLKKSAGFRFVKEYVEKYGYVPFWKKAPREFIELLEILRGQGYAITSNDLKNLLLKEFEKISSKEERREREERVFKELKKRIEDNISGDKPNFRE